MDASAIQYIEQLIGDKGELIQRALDHRSMPKRLTPESAMKGVLNEVQRTVAAKVRDDVLPKLQDMYDTYVLINGEYADTLKNDGSDEVAADDYGSGLDDKVEEILQPWERFLSASWLGVNTIDTKLWQENAIANLAMAAGDEVYKQLAFQKTPAQVLANAGIVQEDVLAAMQDKHNRPQPEKTAMSTDTMIVDIAQTIKNNVGADFDQMTVFNDLEIVIENEDEILVGGSAERLGINQQQIDALATMGMTMAADDLADQLARAIKAASAGSPVASTPAVQNVGAPPVKGKPGRKPTPPEGAASGEPLNIVAALLKEHGGTSDALLATAIGVSRGTYNNYVNSKTPFHPNPEQAATLRGILVDHANNLLVALAKLDGETEPMEVA
jgi:hypothetical protein